MAKRKRAKRANDNFRASWKGTLRFGLVSFNVEAVNAHSKEGGDIQFHQLLEPCHNRIHYQKVCPVHGEIGNDEIVSGYEYARGKYVEIESEELESLRTEKEKGLSIESFIDPEQVDQIYLDGRMYYLLPATSEAREPYHVLAEGMRHQDRWAIGHVIFSGKDQLVLVRPTDEILVMAMLNFPDEIREPKELLPDPKGPTISPQKLKLADEIVKSMTDKHFDFTIYEDPYRERVEELIKAKRAGREVVAPEEDEEPPVINLMDALKRSVEHKSAKHSRSSAKSRSRTRGKPKRKRAS